MSHLELLVLSQHADGELPPDEARVAAAHLASCPDCRARLAHVSHLARQAATAATGAPTPIDDDERTGGCPSPSLLAGWADATLPSPERATLEPVSYTHLTLPTSDLV